VLKSDNGLTKEVKIALIVIAVILISWFGIDWPSVCAGIKGSFVDYNTPSGTIFNWWFFMSGGLRLWWIGMTSNAGGVQDFIEQAAIYLGVAAAGFASLYCYVQWAHRRAS
jgi:hypothetical protein